MKKAKFLIFNPNFESCIINSLLFLKKLNASFYLVSLYEKDLSVVDEYKDFFLNQGWYFIPNTYFSYIDENDCLPRIDFHTQYDEQEKIYKRYYPDLYVETFDNIKRVVDLINPDYILTCLGSLYIYNVLLSAHIRKLFNNDKIYFYRDNPYNNYISYASNRHNELSVFKKMYNCPDTIKQKIYLLNKFNPFLLKKYPTICSNVEIVFNGEKSMTAKS